MIQIAGISSMATRQILSDLAENYERRSGCQVAFTSIGGVEAERRLRTGEAADVVVLARKVMGTLEAEGHIMPGSCKDFAASGIAVAVRSGTERPSIRDEAAGRHWHLHRARDVSSHAPPALLSFRKRSNDVKRDGRAGRFCARLAIVALAGEIMLELTHAIERASLGFRPADWICRAAPSRAASANAN